MLYIVKRDGRKVKFDSIKIANAIKKAANDWKNGSKFAMIKCILMTIVL